MPITTLPRIHWRGLELPHRVQPERETMTDSYGKFIIEPFERGFGTTIGNSLRRTLLAALEGTAVTQIKIAGVQHEFATIPGVMEDVTDIILNIKSLVLKKHSEDEKIIKIDRSRAGSVTAADIIHDQSVEIINPDHHIAELTDDVHFELEMTVVNGRGYVMIEEEDRREYEIGSIPIDSAFSPVVQVSYRTEETRIGQSSNYDRLIMEIWTNGTVTPEMALVEAAKILRKHLNPFIQYSDSGPELPADTSDAPMGRQKESLDPELERKLNQSLAQLELSVRATNCLESEGITTVRDLISRDEDSLLKVRNFGETTLKEVKEKLHKHNLHLGMKLSDS